MYIVIYRLQQTITATQSPITGNTNTLVSASVSGLTAGTTYHFMVKTVNELGTTYDNDMSFTTESHGEPPVLPPYESMIIDFSNFELSNKSAVLNSKGSEKSNWEFVSSVTLKWKEIIFTTLVVPITAYKFALNNQPLYIGNKTWQWSYDAPVVINQVSNTYKARLTGQVRSSDVLWKMYISKDGSDAFVEFLWFEGTSHLDGNEGQWILNHSSQNKVPILQIDWAKTGTPSEVRYTYTKSGDSFKGSYIGYGLTTNTLNAYYMILYFDGQQFSTVNVEWNSTTHNGRVLAINFFRDYWGWHCWDSFLINSICP